MPAPSRSVRLLSARARALNASARPPARRGALPSLYFFTDPARTPDPAKVAAGLPRGAAIVYRAFGAPGALRQARALKALARRRGLVLLIGADAALARRVGADGVHLPERDCPRAPRLRAANRAWIVTVAAHSARALARAARARAHAAILSPLLASASPSAGPPLGPRRGAGLARQALLPVIALGGVTARTAAQARPGFAGIAAIDGLMDLRT